MNFSRSALYLHDGRVSGVEIEGQVWHLDGVYWHWSCRSPDVLEGLEAYDLIAIDGEGLRGEVVPLVQRLRWQGYKRLILVVRFGRSKLERVLTCEAGASEVRTEGLSPAMIEQMSVEQWGDAIEGGRTHSLLSDSSEVAPLPHIVGHQMLADAPTAWLGLPDRNRPFILR